MSHKVTRIFDFAYHQLENHPQEKCFNYKKNNDKIINNSIEYLPDLDIEKEFVALDKSMEKLNSQCIVDLSNAISCNITHDSEKNGQEGTQYIYKDLFEHIHMIKITLQHIARKENKMSDKRFVKAYQNIEYLLSLYTIRNNTFNVMKKALDDVLSSLRLLQ